MEIDKKELLKQQMIEIEDSEVFISFYAGFNQPIEEIEDIEKVYPLIFCHGKKSNSISLAVLAIQIEEMLNTILEDKEVKQKYNLIKAIFDSNKRVYKQRCEEDEF